MGMDDLTQTTPLFVEMYVSTEILHCTHEEYKQLPRLEQKKIITYLGVRGLKAKRGVEDVKFDLQIQKAEELAKSYKYGVK